MVRLIKCTSSQYIVVESSKRSFFCFTATLMHERKKCQFRASND